MAKQNTEAANNPIEAIERMPTPAAAAAEKKVLSRHPEGRLETFAQVFKKVSRIKMTQHGSTKTITAKYQHNGKSFELTATARVFKSGSAKGPLVIYLPWYGGKSNHLRQVLALPRGGSTQIGIDIFDQPGATSKISDTAAAAQHAYALIIRMLKEHVEPAKKAGRQVVVLGLSYGGNILNAYLSHDFAAPDAIVSIEGGNIMQTVLGAKYQGLEYDPKMIKALTKEPRLLPTQTPTNGKAAERSLAVINRGDKVVLHQQETWQNARTKLIIKGPHFIAPIVNWFSIRSAVKKHLKELIRA